MRRVHVQAASGVWQPWRLLNVAQVIFAVGLRRKSSLGRLQERCISAVMLGLWRRFDQVFGSGEVEVQLYRGWEATVHGCRGEQTFGTCVLYLVHFCASCTCIMIM